MYFVQDILNVQSMRCMRLPKWTKSVFPELLADAKTRIYSLITETPYMLRIRAGPLLTDIYKQMNQKQDGKLSRAIAWYSAPDSTLVNVMKALNVVNQTTMTPDYCATLAIELHCGYIDDCNVKVN